MGLASRGFRTSPSPVWVPIIGGYQKLSPEFMSEPEPGNIKVEVEAARERIATVAGVPREAVKISIDFGA